MLLLRPTESATVFLQQLGRGLRLDDDKPCLTVLDFIGGQHANFRFDLRWRALTGVSRRAIKRAVEQDFPTLPGGCHIELDRVAKEIVLDNLRTALPTSKKGLVAELRQLGDVSLAEFLRETGLEVEDVYRRRRSAAGPGCGGSPAWSRPRPARTTGSWAGPSAGCCTSTTSTGSTCWPGSPAGDPPRGPGGCWDMLHFDLWGPNAPLAARDERLARLWASRPAAPSCARSPRCCGTASTGSPAPPSGLPLRVHARYSRNEACAAFGMPNPGSLREGVKWLPDEQADLFFVTLVKSEAHYSPTTMYADRAITDRLFQWESQSTTSAGVGHRAALHPPRRRGVRRCTCSSGRPGSPTGTSAHPPTCTPAR